MKFRKKPVVIDAVQWYPPGHPQHTPVDGVTYRQPVTRFSLDGRYYYIEAGSVRSTQWLSVEKVPISTAEKFKSNGFDGMIGFAHGENRYGRHSLPFATYDVKSGKEEPVDQSSDLYLDYGSAEGWKEHPTGVAIVKTLEGSMLASPGDWIITGVNGEKDPCKPDIFEATYEAVTP